MEIKGKKVKLSIWVRSTASVPSCILEAHGSRAEFILI